MWIKVFIITVLVVTFSLFLVPMTVVVMITKQWDWQQIKKIYEVWWFG